MKSEKGHSLIEVMVVAAIVSALGLGLSGVVGQMLSRQMNLKSSIGLDVFRRNVIALVVDAQSWDISTNMNPSMSCLHTSGAQCTPSQPLPFKIYDAAGTLYYDPTSPTQGIDPFGAPCNTYSVTSTDCPFRMNVQWQANCVAPKCSAPQVIVTSTLTVSKTGQQINTSKYTIPTIYRSAQ